MSAIRLIDANLPEFGIPHIQPKISPSIYAGRLERLRERAVATGVDAFIIYADREHFANMAYLTGFKPRFEEALLLLVGDKPLVILTGPENHRYAQISPIELKLVLYPPFGL